MKCVRIIILSVLFLGIAITLTHNISFADDSPTPSGSPTPTSSSSSDDATKSELQDKIRDYESRITDLEKQSKTLSSQIKIADSQIALNELRINDTKDKIAKLQSEVDITKEKVTNLEGDLETTSKAMIGRVGAVYEVGKIQPWQLFLTSENIPNFMDRAKYLKYVQENDKKTMYAAQQSKLNYAHYQSILSSQQEEQEALEKKLQGYSDQLDADKQAKKQLLADTQGSEANYQKLLNQARAQLASFSRFVSSQGGASILSGQTMCDSWGCYYNQRDSQWGNLSLNGTQYSIASDGCLVTSVAMLFTHYGTRVTPADINSNSSNFASYYPAYLLFTVSAGGRSAQRVGSALDSALSGGDPVVVGVNAYGGTHFVVIKSGSGGNYTMNDPYIPNGHDISFTDHYSMGSIFSIQKLVFI